MSGTIFPNVPNLPGVPALAREVGANFPLPVLAVADNIGLNFLKPAWGIYDQNNNLVLQASSFVKMELAADSDVPTYPMEGGAFQSYNKVNLPYTVKVTVALSGEASIANTASSVATGTVSGFLNGITGTTSRANFINAAATAQASTALYSIVTPEVTYTDQTIVHREFRRTAEQGATLLQIDLWFSLINLTATSTVSNSAATNGAAAQSNGTVQTIPVTSTQLPAIQAAGAN